MPEIFSDSARGNFPKNNDELSARLKSVERCINNDENLREVNVEFCRRAFRLLADCRLINGAAAVSPSTSGRFIVGSRRKSATFSRNNFCQKKLPLPSGKGFLLQS